MYGKVLHVHCRELLEKIKDFEESEFSGARRDTTKPIFKLEPMGEAGGEALLNMVRDRGVFGAPFPVQCMPV